MAVVGTSDKAAPRPASVAEDQLVDLDAHIYACAKSQPLSASPIPVACAQGLIARK